MLSETLSMRGVVFVFVLGIAACESPNPRSCADGICNDQAYPFCDVGGEVAGHPLTCIAVNCAPGQFAACRGEQALACNAMGNDFEVTTCQHGCSDAAGGCNACASNADCANPNPVCDVQRHACRGCQVDDECASQVCDVAAGRCLAETEIVYASPTGAGSGSCSQQQPCSISRALVVATTAATTPTLLLTPGMYTAPLQVTAPAASPLQVVGRQATFVGGITAIRVEGGANVHIRGTSVTAAGGVSCGAASGPRSTVTIEDSTIVTTSAATPASVNVLNCSINLARVDVSFTQGDFAIQLADNATLVADRLHVHANGTPFLVATGKAVTAQVTNSLFDNVALNLSTTDTAPPGSQLLFSDTTFVVAEQQYPLPCTWTTQPLSVTFQDSIVRSHGTGPAVQGVACTFVNSIVSPSSFTPSGALVVDPQFVDPTAGNFHLKSSSPAIDIGTPSSDPGLGHDFDGVSRPQGQKPDLGAFEYRP